MSLSYGQGLSHPLVYDVSYDQSLGPVLVYDVSHDQALDHVLAHKETNYKMSITGFSLMTIIFTKFNHFFNLERKRGLHAIIIEKICRNVGLWLSCPLPDARLENSSFRCQVNLQPHVIFFMSFRSQAMLNNTIFKWVLLLYFNNPL